VRVRQYVVAIGAVAVMAVGASAEGDLKFGSFMVRKKLDAMTDADRSTALTLGESRTSSLAWMCMPDGLNVGLLFGRYLSGDRANTIRVDHRWPDELATMGWWDIAANHKAAFLPIRSVRAFTEKAVTAKTITFRVSDGDGETVTDTFTLTRLADALKQLPCAAALQPPTNHHRSRQ